MLKKNWDDLSETGQKGDWYFSQNDTYISIRYGDDALDVVTIPIGEVQTSRDWKWDGNKERPTIVPSILIRGHKDEPDKWHGFLTNGVLETL